MEASAVEEKRLVELIDQAVQKHLKVNFQDMEEIRRSPAASIIRIESRLDSIEALLDRDMVTRAEFQESFGRVNTRLSAVEANMVTRAEFLESMGKINARLSTVETALEAALKAMVTRAEFHEAMGQVNARLAKLEATTITRVEFKEEMATMRAEFKDEIWKLKLYFILLAALVLLTNPKVFELFGKLWNLF